MSVEVKINDRYAKVELLEQHDNFIKVRVDSRIYEMDLMHTADGTFSIIHEGLSYNIEIVPSIEPKKYMAYTFYHTYEVDIIDAEARYLLNRGGGTAGPDEKSIRSPMPGKVIRIPVREGDLVKKGEIVIILSAMKMESEYKAPADGRVTRVAVREGDLTESGQLLIEIE